MSNGGVIGRRRKLEIIRTQKSGVATKPARESIETEPPALLRKRLKKLVAHTPAAVGCRLAGSL